MLAELNCYNTDVSYITFFPNNGLKAYDVYLKKYILWMKTIHYSNKVRSHLVTIVPMTPFAPISTSKLRSALHFRYSIVFPR